MLVEEKRERGRQREKGTPIQEKGELTMNDLFI